MANGGFDRPQWFEVSAGALLHNLGLFREILGPDTVLAAVVKANAYGHGLAQVAPLALQKANWLAVHSAHEAREIRRLGVTAPVLVMGFVPPAQMYDLDADTHVFVSTEEMLIWLGDYRRRTGISMPVHIKINTGTHRQGIAVDRLAGICRTAVRQGVEVVGAATHFANIEDTLEQEFARRQMDEFSRAIGVLTEALGEEPAYVHSACSAAALLFPDMVSTVARIGISMYGHWPSRETRLTWMFDHDRKGLTLEPVLSWHAVVGQVQDVAAGGTVGYGRTWTALRPTRLAVLPVGYSDGYPRILGNRARVLIRGRAAPVVGRVCMNILMADVTDIPDVGVGDRAVLLGRQGELEVSAEEMAELSGTINYEILARLAAGTPRIVIGDASSGVNGTARGSR